MWERAFLKQNAKMVLQRNYWTAFAVSLVASILVGGNHSASSRWVSNDTYTFNNSQRFDTALQSFVASIDLLALIPTVLISLLLVFGISSFLINPINVGKTRYYVRSRFENTSFSLLFSSFQNNAYMGAVKTMLLRDVFLFLWTLLLWIPGIIKSYAYRMVPYILADNPNIGAMRAIELSNQMTRGEKLNIFVLDLSFLGWLFLGSMACGVGTLFVFPYVEATDAELYAVLKDKAYRTGLCTPAELGDGYPQSI